MSYYPFHDDVSVRRQNLHHKPQSDLAGQDLGRTFNPDILDESLSRIQPTSLTCGAPNNGKYSRTCNETFRRRQTASQTTGLDAIVVESAGLISAAAPAFSSGEVGYNPACPLPTCLPLRAEAWGERGVEETFICMEGRDGNRCRYVRTNASTVIG